MPPTRAGMRASSITSGSRSRAVPLGFPVLRVPPQPDQLRGFTCTTACHPRRRWTTNTRRSRGTSTTRRPAFSCHPDGEPPPEAPRRSRFQRGGLGGSMKRNGFPRRAAWPDGDSVRGDSRCGRCAPRERPGDPGKRPLFALHRLVGTRDRRRLDLRPHRGDRQPVARAPIGWDSIFEYALDLRFATYPSSDRDQTVSIYEAYGGVPPATGAGRPGSASSGSASWRSRRRRRSARRVPHGRAHGHRLPRSSVRGSRARVLRGRLRRRSPKRRRLRSGRWRAGSTPRARVGGDPQLRPDRALGRRVHTMSRWRAPSTCTRLSSTTRRVPATSATRTCPTSSSTSATARSRFSTFKGRITAAGRSTRDRSPATSSTAVPFLRSRSKVCSSSQGGCASPSARPASSACARARPASQRLR